MEIILTKDVANVGFADDIIEVKNGYALNYLIPQGYAVAATKSAKKVHEENKRQRAHKEERLKQEAEEIAEKLLKKKIKVGAKTSTKGTIFGSVNTIQLAEAINNKGFDIDRKKIAIKEDPIKEVGSYTAVISLYRGVSVELPFEVVSE
jgi:large subunit ribosomal protein L9